MVRVYSSHSLIVNGGRCQGRYTCINMAVLVFKLKGNNKAHNSDGCELYDVMLKAQASTCSSLCTCIKIEEDWREWTYMHLTVGPTLLLLVLAAGRAFLVSWQFLKNFYPLNSA